MSRMRHAALVRLQGHELLRAHVWLCRAVERCLPFLPLVECMPGMGRSVPLSRSDPTPGPFTSRSPPPPQVNQLLTEMDGFEAEQQGIVVMGATNRKDVLDAALTRAGRFDRSIEVSGG